MRRSRRRRLVLGAATRDTLSGENGADLSAPRSRANP